MPGVERLLRPPDAAPFQEQYQKQKSARAPRISNLSQYVSRLRRNRRSRWSVPGSWLHLFFFQLVNVADAEFGQLCPQPVEIDSQFTSLQAFTRLLFLGKPLTRQPRNLSSILPLYDDNTVNVGDDRITGPNDRSCANHRNIH